MFLLNMIFISGTREGKIYFMSGEVPKMAPKCDIE